MKAILFFCFAVLSTLKSNSQEDNVYIPLYGSLQGDQYIYADTAYVRAAPGLNATLIDSLFLGDNVTLLSNEKVTSTIKGFLAPWSKIRYSKDGQLKEGYIWAGLLTLNPMRRSDTKFIYGVERVVTTTDKDEPDTKFEDYIIGVKIVVNREKVATYKFKLDSRESTSFTTSQVSEGKGLTNIKNIIALTFSGEACAIPTLTYRFGWTGKKLCQLPLEEDVVDAGVLYYDEELIFPTDKGGISDRVIMKIDQGEATDKTDKNGEPIYKTIRERKVYKWDGIKIIPG